MIQRSITVSGAMVISLALLQSAPSWADERGKILSPSPITSEEQGQQIIKGKIIAKDSKGVVVRGDPSGHEVSLDLDQDKLKDLSVGDVIEASLNEGQTDSIKKTNAGTEGAGLHSSGTVPQSLSDRSEQQPAGPGPRTLRPDSPSRAEGAMASVPSKECEDCRVLQARVLAVDQNTLLVRDRSKTEVKLKLNKDTIVGQENPKYGGYTEGDRIEAYVRPSGEVHSITMLRPTMGRPGPDDLGD